MQSLSASLSLAVSAKYYVVSRETKLPVDPIHPPPARAVGTVHLLVSVLLHDNDAYPVPVGTVPDLKTTMNANNIAIPDDMFLNVFGGHVV